MIKMGKWTKKQLSHSLDLAKQIEQIDAQTFDMDMMMQKIYQDHQKRVTRNATIAQFSSLGHQQ